MNTRFGATNWGQRQRPVYNFNYSQPILTIQEAKLLLKDLFKVGYKEVGLGLDVGGEDVLLTSVWITPKITVSPNKLKKLFNNRITYSHWTSFGCPAHWPIVFHYLGDGCGNSTNAQGNRPIPQILVGKYSRETWRKELDYIQTESFLKNL